MPPKRQKLTTTRATGAATAAPTSAEAATAATRHWVTSITRLTTSLRQALSALSPDQLSRLACEIDNDWTVPQLICFVEGFIAAGRRDDL
jgi:hypothetical protein